MSPLTSDAQAWEANTVFGLLQATMGRDAYFEWVKTAPNDNGSFLAAAQAKLAELEAGDASDEQDVTDNAYLAKGG